MKQSKADGYSLKKTLFRMLQNVSQRNKKIYFYLTIYTVFLVIYPFLAVLLPKLMISVLENGSENGAEKILVIAGGYFAAASLAGFIIAVINGFAHPELTKLRIHYLGENFRKLNSIDYKYREDSGFFDENQRALEANSSGDNGVEGIYHKLFDFPAEFLTIVIFVIFIGWRNPFILIGLAISILCSLWSKRRVHKYEYSLKEEKNKAYRRKDYYYRTTHDFAFGKDIRIFGFQSRILENYNEEIKKYISVLRRVKNKEFLYGFLELCTALLCDILIYGSLVFQVLKGMTIADFSMYLVAVLSLSTSLRSFADRVSYIYSEGQYVHDFYEFLDRDLGQKGGERKRLTGDTLEITFKNMSFCYPKTDQYIYKNLNFTIHRGEKLAIVGINGAGKSTLVKLMTGLFEPTEGEILVNGIPAREFDREEYFKMFSVVFQDVNILAFTITENVACSTKQADDKRVLESLDQVGLGDKVRKFEKGTGQMMLKVIDENGTQFSGGESQKLAIARALYKDANMVVLDEPTAALDALAEAEIYQNFSELVGGKTAVYISHRLASTKFCDKIALFDQDGLAEYGTHDELMEQQGEYYKMFMVQGKYYQEGEANEAV